MGRVVLTVDGKITLGQLRDMGMGHVTSFNFKEEGGKYKVSMEVEDWIYGSDPPVEEIKKDYIFRAQKAVAAGLLVDVDYEKSAEYQPFSRPI